MQHHQQPLAKLKLGLHKYPQVLVNVKISDNCDLSQKPRIQDALHSVEGELAMSATVPLRRSGTEPLVRVMVEGNDETRVTQLANQLADVVKEELTG